MSCRAREVMSSSELRQSLSCPIQLLVCFHFTALQPENVVNAIVVAVPVLRKQDSAGTNPNGSNPQFCF